MDPLGEITPEKVNGFLSKHYDPDLGWAPRPNQTDDINSIGARSTHEYEDLRNTISVYGDSATFGAGVPVEDAWPTLLEEKLGRGVLNFGVGGYGTDQALLRLEKQYTKVPSATVLLCIQVENINRCVNLFRGFYQHGFGPPKPRFVLKDEELVLYNPFDTPEAVHDVLLDHPDRLLSMAQQYDYWFGRQQLFGKPWRITFPYLLQLAARVPFILSRLRIGATNIGAHAPLYDPGTEGFMIMQGIVRRFLAFADAQEFKGLIVIIPTPRDVLRWAAKDELTYQGLVDFLTEQQVPFLDLMEPLSREPDIAAVLVHPRAVHFNHQGGDIVSEEVLRFLREQDALPNGQPSPGADDRWGD